MWSKRKTFQHIATAVVFALVAVLVGAADLAAQPRDQRPAAERGQRRGDGRLAAGQRGQRRHTVERAVADRSQLNTLAFSGLCFITGDFGASTFMPPGKVCDFFGFQYMRDNDAAGKGHNPLFLNRAAANVLYVLNDEQRSLFENAARGEAQQLKRIAQMRYPLIAAFFRERDGRQPEGSQGLNRDAVAKYVGDIFALDAAASYERAQVFAKVASSLTPQQKEYLAKMDFGNFDTWPEVNADRFRLPRGTDPLANIANMTYASEFFSWYAGSIEADTYFCPEGNATYFGAFYVKGIPARGRGDYDIDTDITGSGGERFLAVLTPEQRGWITALVEQQREALMEIVEVRRAISTKLRKFLRDEEPDKEEVVALGRRYGELDGEISHLYAVAFGNVNRSLTDTQRKYLVELRGIEGYEPAPAYLFSQALRRAPELSNIDRFFFPLEAVEKGE